MIGPLSRLRWGAVASALLASLLVCCGPSSSHPTVVVAGVGEGGTVGSWGHRILASAQCRSLVVEIATVSSEAPSDYALGVLQTRLQQRCDKPDGITFVAGASFTSTKTIWSLSDIAAVEQQVRQVHPTDTKAAIFVLYLNGNSDADTADAQVVGMSYSGTSFAIFKDVARKGGPFLSGNVVEATALVHESGHLFGLVNLGAPLESAHVDSGHPFHCTNPQCVMYWEAESTQKTTIVAGQKTPDDFDAACLADLRANGGK